MLLSSIASAQQGLGTPGGPDGTITREQMWRAATREEWQKPCLITWQRNWEDAIAVSQETGKPILVCVNMDGEIASEHYAGVRYRQPETASLYDPYVCVIASTYRHNPKDHDVHGHRIPCPRFGGVTCGEHIAIEPGLFDEYFEGQRVAPRHIMIELDKKEVYDVYYAFDTDSVFNVIRKGIADRPDSLLKDPRVDQGLVDKVSSRDTKDREAIEVAYRKGTREVRLRLLQAALENLEVAQVDLLRLALFGEDKELKGLAWKALSESAPDSAVTLIGDALAVMTDEAERQPLIASLERLGESSEKARSLARVHQGLGEDSGSLNLAEWGAALASAEYQATQQGSSDLDERVEVSAEAALEHPNDGENQLDLAESYLALARHPDTDPKYARLHLMDARTAAMDVEQNGGTGWRVNAILALIARQTGDREQAFARAEAAMDGMPGDTEGWISMEVLDLFARVRQRDIAIAYRRKTEWPPSWLTDLHSAYSLLAQHPLGTDEQMLRHYDFLKAIGATGHAGRVLEAGIRRFPASAGLHDRFRGRALANANPSEIGGRKHDDVAVVGEVGIGIGAKTIRPSVRTVTAGTLRQSKTLPSTPK